MKNNKSSLSNSPQNNLLRIVFIMIIIGFGQLSHAQLYHSMIGIRANHNTAQLSAKIALDKVNALEGSIGVFTPQEEYTVGSSVAWHRHIKLTESRKLQAYYGIVGRAVIGDEEGFGAGIDLGLTYIHKRINIGIDFSPTYFFNENLGFRPLFGAHLRYVNR